MCLHTVRGHIFCHALIFGFKSCLEKGPDARRPFFKCIERGLNSFSWNFHHHRPLISFFKPKVFSLQTCCLICHQKWWKLHFFFWFIVSVKMLQKLSLNSSCFFSALLLSFVILLFSLRIFCGLDSRLTKIPVHWVDKGDYCKIRWFSTRFSSRSWCLQGNEKLTASSFCKKKKPTCFLSILSEPFLWRRPKRLPIISLVGWRVDWSMKCLKTKHFLLQSS